MCYVHQRVRLAHPVLADKQVFAQLDVVGWYVTGSELQPEHMAVHTTVRCLVHVQHRCELWDEPSQQAGHGAACVAR
jgi:hypothetical protein